MYIQKQLIFPRKNTTRVNHMITIQQCYCITDDVGRVHSYIKKYCIFSNHCGKKVNDTVKTDLFQGYNTFHSNDGFFFCGRGLGGR